MSKAPISGLSDRPEVRRSEFAALVWKHTIRSLAQAIGCSDPLLNKFCKKWTIPTPTKAQRGALMSGKPVKISVLPPLGDASDPNVAGSREGRVALIWPPVPPRARPGKARQEAERQEFLALLKSTKARKTKPNFSFLRGPEEPTTVIYVLRVTSWSSTYEFGVSFQAEPDEALREASEILIRCEIIEPRKVKGRESKVRLIFLEHLNGSPLGDHVGFSQASCSDCLLRAPRSAASMLMEGFGAGRLRFLKIAVVSGTRRQNKEVRRFSFAGRLEDWDEE